MLIDDKLLLLGIRHHGPGSAASAVQALIAFAPDCILLEGCAETESILSFVDDPGLIPPVAALIYAPDDVHDSVFYPFTQFSPEWQTLKFARARNIEVRMMDLPQTHQLALARQQRQAMAEQASADIESEEANEADATDSGSSHQTDSLSWQYDPLDLLARAAGYEDGERWWERVVEQHSQGVAVFEAIGSAMTALREQIEAQQPLSHREALREAWMRRTLRKAVKDGFNRIAVVCGAWHVPALARKTAVKDDDALLKNLPKLKMQATWIPWSYGRISYRSGYGAGVASPGWYDHLWHHHQHGTRHQITTGWLTLAARQLRDEGHDVPPASVIEAVRLAETLATLRDSALPSLHEMNEAIQTLYCFGQSSPLLLLEKKLIVGERLGQVPDSLPKVPLQEDLQAQQKRLRLKVSSVEAQLELDLRTDNGLERSALLHRLLLLDIPWGKALTSRSSKGTFKEMWELRWQPEFELRLVEMSPWGSDIASAAHHFVSDKLRNTDSLAEVARWIDQLLLANLAATIANAIARLQALSAGATDIGQLMQALPRLVNVVRYGDVRGTDTHALLHVVEGFCSRIMIGLAHFSRQVDEHQASEHAQQIQQMSETLNLLDRADFLADWWLCLEKIRLQEDTQPIIRGRCVRLLLNANIISSEQAESALRLALSAAQEPLQAAQWIEGLLASSGLLLVHDDQLWHTVDHYVCQLDAERFLTVLPLLRRTFAGFTAGERSQLQQRARRDSTPAVSHTSDFNYAAIAPAMPLLYQLLGISPEATP